MVLPGLAPFVQDFVRRNANSSPSPVGSTPNSHPLLQPSASADGGSWCLLLLACSGMWIYNFIAGTRSFGLSHLSFTPSLSPGSAVKTSRFMWLGKNFIAVLNNINLSA